MQQVKDEKMELDSKEPGNDDLAHFHTGLKHTGGIKVKNIEENYQESEDKKSIYQNRKSQNTDVVLQPLLYTTFRYPLKITLKKQTEEELAAHELL